MHTFIILLLQVDVIEGDRESRGSTVYSTATRGIPPPLVTTEFTVEDNGKYTRQILKHAGVSLS